MPSHPAAEIEDRYRTVLKDNRARDAAAGRTLDGPHLTDLSVVHAAKNIPASDASTGEQKALLIGLVLAHAGLLAEMTGFAPLLLLDEVVAHLDPGRRAALYRELEPLGAQVWMTGADPAAFAEIAARAGVPGRAGQRRAASLIALPLNRRSRRRRSRLGFRPFLRPFPDLVFLALSTFKFVDESIY